MGRLTPAHYQDAVYWSFSGVDNYGEVKVSSPIALKVRWEDTQSEIASPEGDTIRSDAQVYVDRVIAEGSMLWKGHIDDLPSPVTNVKKVVASSDIPNIKGRANEYRLDVVKFGDSLPTVE